MSTIIDRATAPSGRRDKVNLWNNVVPAILLVIVAVFVVPGGIGEGGWNSVDDVVIGVLTLGGIAWIIPSANRYARSMVPIGLLGGAFVMKLLALLIERNEKDDLGDDVFGLVLLAVFIVVSGLLYYFRRPSAA